jgi:3-oxoadipate enol-lactonase
MEVSVPYAALNGQRFWFEDSGGDSPVMVLSHGFLMDQEMFEPQVAAFRDSWRVITWDWRGFGRTEIDGQAFTVWDQADDLLGLLDHLGVDDAVLVGMSHGGYISIRTALIAPDRVRALILIDTSASGLEEHEKPAYRALFDKWVTDGPTDELTQTFGGMLLGDPELEKVWVAKWRLRPKELLRTPAQATVEVEDVRRRLPEVTCPALVIHGEDDAAFPATKANEIAALLPGSGPPVLVPGRHAASLSHPEPVNAAIAKFLTGL